MSNKAHHKLKKGINIMNTFKTQNLNTAAIFAALSETFANDYISEEGFLHSFNGEDLDKTALYYLSHILRLGKTAKIALDTICMEHLYTDILKEVKSAACYKDLIKEAGPLVFDDIQIGGLKLHHKAFIDKFIKYTC